MPIQASSSERTAIYSTLDNSSQDAFLSSVDTEAGRLILSNSDFSGGLFSVRPGYSKLFLMYDVEDGTHLIWDIKSGLYGQGNSRDQALSDFYARLDSTRQHLQDTRATLSTYLLQTLNYLNSLRSS